MAQLRTLILGGLAALTLLACGPKKTADLELAAAEKAIADAKANRAANCAKETYATAESLVAQAKALAEKGDVDGAKAKAAEAESLANQARAASPEGCDKPPEERDAQVDPNRKAGGDTEAGARATLGDLSQTVYFDYNEATIREDSKALLSRAAQVLLKDPNLKIEIEGHCDARGSTEYNLHLGERRARAVEKYLMTQGAKSDQISVISYGEERLVDLGETEEAHGKNRRAELKPQ